MRQINRVGVIGAGTMGAAIAAHLANSGRPVLLLDAVPTETTPAEAARGLTLTHPSVRNRLALAGLERVKNSRPPALFTAETVRLITPGNVEDDLGGLSDVDWIVEAITERIDVKRSLYERVENVRRPGTIVSSNTSGLPIGRIAEGRSADFRAHFLGTHFFNPPRQMKLLEVTPTSDTLPEVTATIREVGERDLGKGVVLCRDTPNFIGNRLFTFDIVFVLDYAIEHGYTVEEVDLLTGPLVGRPRTGTFRLLDLIGLDVMSMVSDNLYPAIPNDESRELLRSSRVSGLVRPMIERGWLGNKSGLGFYKEARDADGRSFWALDLAALEHRPPRSPVLESVAAIQKERDLATRLRLLVGLDDRAGQLVRAVLANVLGYASRRLPEIADDVQSVDRAMRWGFNHQLGPFEIWDALGVPEGQRLVNQNNPHGAASWVDRMVASGRSRFYQEGTHWSVTTAAAAPREESPDRVDLPSLKASRGVVVENAGASLVDLGDGIAALELHTKMNTLDDRVVEMIDRALEKTRADFRGLVLTGAGAHFSAGANLAHMADMIASSRWDDVDRTIRSDQDAFMALRFSATPVVAAPFGWTLGGGAELAMAADRIVAAAETYVGQVEVGVGLIPAAGGCKELVRRIVSPVASTRRPGPGPALEQVFKLIAQGKASGSAAEARDWGFLTPSDRIVMNPDHLLATAKREAIALADAGYRPPTRGLTVFAAGRDALAGLKIDVYLYREAGYASAYDVEIANRVAYVICGGDLSEPSWVEEQYILDLERSTFVQLCQHPKTQERIRHFLETGKTLKN